MSGLDSRGVTKRCIECIGSVLANPEFGLDCSNAPELCKVLQDGEILCCLLTELSSSDEAPGAFYSVNSQLLAKKNIQFFLKHCAEQFGAEMFEPEDLLQLRNPERVVSSLCHLLTKLISSRDKDAAVQQKGQMESVIQEICEHEKRLIDKLMQMLIFRKELLGLLSEWTNDLISVVFRHTEQLYYVHWDFYNKLIQLARQGSKQFCQQLHCTFVDMSPRLEIYFQYFSHLPTAHAQMAEAFVETPECKNQLLMLEAIISKPLPFQSLLDAPIRQPTNYLQLFTRLSKVAARECPETKPSVEKTLTELEKLLNRANFYKRQNDQVEATQQVFATITNLPSGLSNPAETGLLLADCSFKVTLSRATQQKESRDLCHCVLTTKQLLIAGKKEKKLPLNYWFHLPITSSLQVVRSDSTSIEVQCPETKIFFKLESRKKKLISEAFIKQLHVAHATCFPKGWNERGHMFELTSFPFGMDCYVCRQSFNGSVLQGFICRRCNCRVDPHCLDTLTSSCIVLPGSLAYLKYFHRGLDRDRASAILRDKPPDSFLIREKGGNTGQKVVSIKTSSNDYPIVHIEIVEENGKFYFGQNQSRFFSSIDNLIDHYKRNNLIKAFRNIDGKLANGVMPT